MYLSICQIFSLSTRCFRKPEAPRSIITRKSLEERSHQNLLKRKILVANWTANELGWYRVLLPALLQVIQNLQERSRHASVWGEKNSVWKHIFSTGFMTKPVFTASDGSQVTDIAVDWMGRNIYWLGTSVSVTTIDGKATKKIPTSNCTGTVTSIALDSDKGYVYFTCKVHSLWHVDWLWHAAVQRCSPIMSICRYASFDKYWSLVLRSLVLGTKNCWIQLR